MPSCSSTTNSNEADCPSVWATAAEDRKCLGRSFCSIEHQAYHSPLCYMTAPAHVVELLRPLYNGFIIIRHVGSLTAFWFSNWIGLRQSIIPQMEEFWS